ncbi:hypothetical protein, partial [Staphylococcus aureus]|uniref:hypothetical protein n=1 Tax=Staphylococcus aureus TaxID=1280 RepID=UPI002108B885
MKRVGHRDEKTTIKVYTHVTEKMDSIDRKLPGLSERERKIISKHTKSIINQMLILFVIFLLPFILVLIV